jgi:serine/threonine protein kinase
LAVILFIMVAGYLPFDDDNLNGLFKKILKGDANYPKFMSSDLRDLLEHMIVVDPKARYSLEEVMKHKWFEVGFEKIVYESIEVPKEGNPQDFQTIEETEKKKKKVTKINSMTAFDLTSVLVLGSINPFLGKVIQNDQRFIVKGSLNDVQEIFKKIFLEMKGQVSDKKNIVKAIFQAQGLFTSLSIEIQPIVGDCCLCEVKRGRGDILQFNTLYRVVMEKADTFIISKH